MIFPIVLHNFSTRAPINCETHTGQEADGLVSNCGRKLRDRIYQGQFDVVEEGAAVSTGGDEAEKPVAKTRGW